MSKTQYMVGACMALVASLAACGEKEAKAPTLDTPENAAARTAAKQACTEISVPDPKAAFLTPEEALAKTDAFLAENAVKEGVTVTDSGLQFETLGPGTGKVPTETDIVTVHYCGRLPDGSVFDSSIARDESVTFPLDQVIPGWKEGLLLMKEGDWAKFTLPPDLAYGTKGTPDGTIGPNTAISFEVELIKTEDRAEFEAKMKAEEAERMAQLAEIAAANVAEEEQFLAENAKKEGIITTQSGLQYEIVEKGDGTVSPAASDKVEVHYRGTLINGKEFDSSYSRGQTATFPLNGVIAGWTEGVQLMSEGDKFRFYVPSKMAYGERGAGADIGPSAMLIFDVELIDVKDK